MTQSASSEASDLFKFISLRGSDDELAIDPGDLVSGSVVLRLLEGVPIDPAAPGAEVLARLEAAPSLTDEALAGLEIGHLADALDASPPATREVLEAVRVPLGGVAVPAAELARRPSFPTDLRRLYDSWLALRLKEPRSSRVAKHVRLLRAAYLAHRLATASASLSAPGTIGAILRAQCKLPEAWMPARARAQQLRARHARVLAGRSQVQPSDIREAISQKKQQWTDLAKRLTQLDAIRSQAAREHFVWSRQQVPSSPPTAVMRRELPTRELDDRFYEGLSARLTEPQRATFNEVLARMPGGRPGSFDDAISGFDSLTVSVEANELCAEIRALEQQADDGLPVVASHPLEDQHPSVRAIGWGDLIVARERLVRYAAREIAHIENVLPGETKLREHERRNTTQEVVESETTTEKTTELDSQTTDRYELQTQSQESIQQNFSIQAGVNTSGRYGLTHVDTSLETGFQQSKSESRSNAQTVAKEIVSKAVERTFERVRELRRRVVTEDIRELNRHQLANAAPEGGTAAAISGLYLWVEKVQQVELRHYGTRLMLELNIPEPGLSLFQLGPASAPRRRLPAFDLGPASINAGNYLCKAQQFAATDVEPPPAQFINVGSSWATAPSEDAEEWGEDTITDTLAIPDGYRPIDGVAIVSAIKGPNEPVDVHLAVGGLDVIAPEDATDGKKREGFAFNPSVPWPNGVPVALRAKGHFDKTLMAQVVLRCERTSEALSKWQLQTWEKLRSGYELLQRQLDREVETEQRVRAVFGGVISSRPASENRRVERDELKKWAIKAMRLKPQNFNAVERVGDFQEVSPIDADLQAPIVGFFEEAFEWSHMSYFLYPYFWARRESWRMRNNVTTSDPQHTAFLNAGAARIVVSVTPGYEARVLHYLESDPRTEELTRLAGPPTAEVPPGTSFEDLWLELLTERQADVALGSGSLSVTGGDARAVINGDSRWSATERDVGRELYIGGDRYTVAALITERELRLDRPYEGPTDAGARYATGSVPYGPPWLVNVPTTLVLLDENKGRLDDLV